ncbi:MAG TPA: caspase family protein, partial [Micromonosporaceae bacterium]|nr:caspase family protein [Micromonosporaceae bacterium]
MADRGPNRAFLGVAVESYQDGRFERLEGARAQMKALAERLREFGFDPTCVEDPTIDELRNALATWRNNTRQLRPDAVLVAWSSHAHTLGADLQLLAADSDPRSSDTVYHAGALAEHACAAADQVLILLDTCHAGAGVVDALRHTLTRWELRSLPPGRRAWLGILAACQAGEQAAGQGLLIDRVTSLLSNGPAGEYRAHWAVRTRGVSGIDLIQAAYKEWPHDCGQRLVDAQTGDAVAVFRNPRWRPTDRPELVEHLVRAAQGADRIDEGWFFSGRREVLREVVAWLDDPRPGLFTVTGPAGCGKSAVVGRVASLSHQAWRADILRHAPLDPDDPDPGAGRVDATLHLRGLDLEATVTALAHDLGLARPANAAELVAEVSRLETHPVLVVDGLDEAAVTQAGRLRQDLLEPLGRVAKVLLATRDRAYQARAGADPGPDGSPLVPDDAHVIDLAEAPHTEADIAEYLCRRLAAGGLPADRVNEVAPEVARLAASDGGGFLYARIVAGQVVRRQLDVSGDGWTAGLARSIAGAFAADLDAGDHLVVDGLPAASAAHDLLRALAWAQGRGLPAGEVWETLATALGGSGVTYGPDEVDAALGRYGRYVVEDSEDGRAVYRLYHREFVRHLQQSQAGADGRPPAQVVAATIVGLVRRQTGDGRHPDRADPYLRRYLSTHAVEAAQPGVALLRGLAQANPDAYLPNLAASLNNLAVHLAEVGRRDQALAPITEAVDIYRRLAQANPDAYLPDLAMSLNNLALGLAGVGRRDQALAPITEAVDIYRRLAQAN